MAPSPSKKRLNIPVTTVSNVNWAGRLGMALLWVLSFFIFYRRLDAPMSDFDLWWHLAAGADMTQNLHLLTQETFSHTLLGTPWINFEWLGEILIYLVFKIGGYGGLYYGRIFLSLFIIMLGVLTLRLVGLRRGWLLVATWWMFFTIRPRLNERLELFTFFFLPLYIGLLLLARKQAAFRSKNTLAFIFISMVLWCNLHGGFIYGLGVLGLFTLGTFWAQENRETQRFFKLSCAVGLVATLVNPFGYKLVPFIVDLIRQVSLIAPMIGEWESPGIFNHLGFWLLFGLSGILVLRGVLKQDRWTKLWAPTVVLFAAWGGHFSRNSALFPFMALPYLGSVIAEKQKSKKIKHRLLFEGLPLLLCLWFMITHVVYVMHPSPRAFVAWEQTPQKACQFVAEQNLQGNLYNSYENGGFICWYFQAAKKIFMDTRYVFAPLILNEDRWLSSSSLDEAVKGLSEYLDSYHVEYAITRYPLFKKAGLLAELTPLNLFFPRTHWALVYWDDVSLVFVKRNSLNQNVIAQHEYKTLWPYNLAQTFTVLTSDIGQPAQFKLELERHRQEVGETQRGQQLQQLLERG